MENTNVFKEDNRLTAPKLLDVVCSNNHFAANGWEYEIAKKYLYEVNGKMLELGFYDHYEDKSLAKHIKRVLELPTSYDCPMKCAYCASSWIKQDLKLSADVLFYITNKVLENHNILENDSLLIALTGTGDAFFTLDTILDFINLIIKKYNNFSFTVSSCNWTAEMLNRIEKAANTIEFRNVQATYISHDTKTVFRIIPGLRRIGFNFTYFLKHVRESKNNFWRINYLLLDSVNSSNDSFNEFVNLIEPVKEKLIVRISALNETIASKNSGLRPASLERAVDLRNKIMGIGAHAYLFHSDTNDNMNCGQLMLESSHRNINILNNQAV